MVPWHWFIHFNRMAQLWGKYANQTQLGSDKVAQTGRSDKVALTRSLWQGRSDKVTLTRSLWQGRSDKVALTRSLWQGRSDKVALTRSLWLLRGFLIPIINTTFIELSTTAYLRLLFLSSSYPKTQPLVPLLQERPIYNGSKDHLLDKRKRRRYVWWLLLGELLKG